MSERLPRGREGGNVERERRLGERESKGMGAAFRSMSMQRLFSASLGASSSASLGAEVGGGVV